MTNNFTKAEYPDIFNAVSSAIIIYDKNTRKIIEVNNAAVDLFGYTKDEFTKFKAGTLGTGEEPFTESRAIELIEKAKNEGTQRFDWLTKNKNGKEFWIRVEIKRAVISGKERLVALIQDINEQKIAESSLKKSEDKYRYLLESIPVGIVIHSDRKIVYINNYAIKVGKGTSKEQFIGKDILDFIAPESMELVKERVSSLYGSKSSLNIVEENFLCLDGSKIIVEVNASPFIYKGKLSARVILREITEKKLYEEKLTNSEKSYRELFNNTLAAIYIQEPDGTFIDVNKGAEMMYGYPKEFFIGRTPADLSAPGKNDLDLIKECVINAFQGIPQQFEFWGKRKNGEIFPKLVKLNKGTYFGKDVIFAYSLDITEIKAADAERQILEERIMSSQKLESLGLLAGGIAHDFNNYLTGILGNAGLARMETDSNPKLASRIETIENTAVRAADLCNQLLAYSGRGRFEVKPIDINKTISKMTGLLKTSIPKKIEITFNLEENLPSIEADISQIRQIFMNVVINSSEAIGDDTGTISITTKVVKLGSRYLESTLPGEKLKKGKYVLIEISDTGSGIKEEYLKNIFDPFFTTKDTGKGLGLAAVIGIVKGHNGSLKVYSEPGKGTSFKIFFPVSPRAAVLQGEEDSREIKLRGSGTILIADDEETIRTLGKNILEKFGFKVITAIDGEDTLIKFKENSGSIDLVLLDMTMPKKDGVQVFKEIKEKSPDIKIILSSGYNEQDATNRFTSDKLAGFIQKPYRPEDLLNKIFSVLKKKKNEK